MNFAEDKMKKIFAILVLVFFLVSSVGGAVFLLHLSGTMANCPLSATGTFLCPLHPVTLAIYVIYLFALAFALFYITLAKVFLPLFAYRRFPQKNSPRRKILRRLSLFENSPDRE